MAAFVICPSCGGQGFVPLDAVADIEAADIERAKKQLAAQQAVADSLPPPTRSRDSRAEQ